MKLLINLFTEDIEVEKIKEYSSAFKSFVIHHYQFQLDEMYPDILESMIGHIQEQDNFDINKTTIIFQTNVADIGHFSANFYSEMIDGVIIVQDSVTALTSIYPKYNWILEIAQAKSDKLRLNNVCIVDDEIDDFYIEFSFFNKLINNIKPIESLSLPARSKLEHDLEFITSIGEVSTNSNIGNFLSIDNRDNYWYALFNNHYGMKLVGLALTQSIKTHIKFCQALELMIQSFSRFSSKEKILEIFNTYITIEKLTLNKFVDYNLYRTRLGDKDILRSQYFYLKKKYKVLDKNQIHALISNSVFYETKLEQDLYFGLYQDRMFLMKQLTEHWKGKINLGTPQRKNNRIAICAGQLLAFSHAPTQWAINYANMFKKYNADLEIKIFVDDWANYSPDDLGWSNVFRSGVSSSGNDIHKKYLNPEIEVYYSNNTLNRHQRIQQDVDAILEFQPQFIFKIGSRYSITTNLLYDHYPVISHTIGGMEDSEYVDIFTGGYTEEIATELYREQGLYNVNYLRHTVGIEEPISEENKSRHKYGLDKNSAVLVTVGNRLAQEITDEFINQMKQILVESSQVQWVIVGSTGISLISDHCKEYVDNGQIIYLKYEKNLFDFYKICDIYVNPFRKSGGNSAAIAMKAGLPIVTTDVNSDVGGFVGPLNCIKEEELAIEVIHLLQDKAYYQKKSNEMLNKINNYFSFDNTYRDLKSIFNKAKYMYQMRLKK